jgi:hypothetical protein
MPLQVGWLLMDNKDNRERRDRNIELYNYAFFALSTLSNAYRSLFISEMGIV